MNNKIRAFALLCAMNVCAIALLCSSPQPAALSEGALDTTSPAEFQRPSNMEHVIQTNSCVVGGTVKSSRWHVGVDTYDVGAVAVDDVLYTSFNFLSDEGREFVVAANGAMDIYPTQSFGLELYCDPTTMHSDEAFQLLAIIWSEH
jgi:hypothetical protein